VLILKPIITGIVLDVHAPVTKQVNAVMATVMLMKTVKPAKLIAVYAVNVVMVRCLTVLITIAVQSLGLVMDLKTVKTRLMAVTLPAMTVTVATVQILPVVMVLVTVMKPKHHVRKIACLQVTAQTVNLIGRLTDLNAVILHGVSMV
tara:strand:- start:122 stop:562 length:441 start_codon:yes stop_codon:yes gene_type:complete